MAKLIEHAVSCHGFKTQSWLKLQLHFSTLLSISNAWMFPTTNSFLRLMLQSLPICTHPIHWADSLGWNLGSSSRYLLSAAFSTPLSTPGTQRVNVSYLWFDFDLVSRGLDGSIDTDLHRTHLWFIGQTQSRLKLGLQQEVLVERGVECATVDRRRRCRRARVSIRVPRARSQHDRAFRAEGESAPISEINYY